MAEQWAIDVQVTEATRGTTVALMMSSDSHEETHDVPLRVLDEQTHVARYGLTLDIARDDAFDAGATTRYTCNEPVRTDVMTEN